jgi:hypothetical protein
MSPLQQKLQQLNLSAMSHHIETTIAEAAAKNLSVDATIEWLADLELEERQRRAIERRFQCSGLQAQPSIDDLIAGPSHSVSTTQRPRSLTPEGRCRTRARRH